MISIIAAIGENRELGKDNKLLWNISEDMERFRGITTGHPVIVGQNTFESIGRPLPDRVNIILTKDEGYKADGAFVAHTPEEALQVAQYESPGTEIFVIGGAMVYKTYMPFVHKLYLTIVHATFKDADTFFPPYEYDFSHEVFRDKRSNGVYSYTFLELERSNTDR